MNAWMLELVGGPLRAMRRATFWWCLGLSALVAVTMSVWPAFKGSSGISQAIDQLPSGVVQAFGLADFGTPPGFLRANLYDFFVPLLIVIAAVVLANGQTAGEEASGRMELYLAQPIDRRSALLGRAVAALLAVVLICLVLGLAQLGSNMAFGLSIDTGYLVSTIALCGLLAVLHGSLAVALAGISGRPSLVLGVGIGVGSPDVSSPRCSLSATCSRPGDTSRPGTGRSAATRSSRQRTCGATRRSRCRRSS